MREGEIYMDKIQDTVRELAKKGLGRLGNGSCRLLESWPFFRFNGKYCTTPMELAAILNTCHANAYLHKINSEINPSP